MSWWKQGQVKDGGRNRRMDQKGLNHSNGEGPTPLAPGAWCSRLLSTTSAASLPWDQASGHHLGRPSRTEEQGPQGWAWVAGASEPTHCPSLSPTGIAKAGIPAAGSSTRPSRPRGAEAGGS